MNREIKFRAWGNGKMTYDLETIWCGTTHRLGYIYMQYTGLKDKNGVEIYEGDIVQNYNDQKPNQQIIFAKGMFCLDDGDSPLWKYAPRHFWEVIGNIYQNPELLK